MLRFVQDSIEWWEIANQKWSASSYKTEVELLHDLKCFMQDMSLYIRKQPKD